MGAWGYRNFENDSALDFIGVLVQNGSANEVFATISAVAGIADKEDSDYGPEVDEASNCLAAIELIAAAKGKPSQDIPDEAMDWLKKHNPLEVKIGGVLGWGKKKVDMIALSNQAIKQVKENSELKELWEESEDYENWMNILNDLERRIS
jgi:hypothetical protein